MSLETKSVRYIAMQIFHLLRPHPLLHHLSSLLINDKLQLSGKQLEQTSTN